MAELHPPAPSTAVPDEGLDLDQGRGCYARGDWAGAFKSLSLADQAMPLGAEDLERFATSAYLVGRDDDYLRALERAHHAHIGARQSERAVRCAFWLGLHLFLRGEFGPGAGWLARAERLLAGAPHSSVEAGYLLVPSALQRIEAADCAAAYAMASEAAEIGNRFADADLIAAALYLQGCALLRQGEVGRGLTLLDETMVAVAAGELSPIVTGLIYCGVIGACRQVYALGRAQEWTAALTGWCERQPGIVFAGQCLVHRAEIMQLQGAWPDAVEEARRAHERLAHRADRRAAAAAFYQEAEVHRLKGEFAAAEESYRNASAWGYEPQPGLALLRLAQGRIDAALGAVRRVLAATADPLQRTRFLPTYVEVLLAAGDIQEARGAARELEAIAGTFDAGVLGAIAAHARGATALAEGNAETAVKLLRFSLAAWQELEAPYLAARVRVQIGLACRALDDSETAELELVAARAVFEQLGAAPDLARLDALNGERAQPRPYGLTRRELQVLRFVAAGMTNKAIAGRLFLSEKTVDRHVSNIFNKLDVCSRSAATAFAYSRKLI